MIDGIYIILLILAVAIPIVWYLAKRATTISDDVLIDFSDRSSHMTPWLEKEISKKYSSKDPKILAKEVLDKVYGVKVNKKNVAIGLNLYEKYYNKTGEIPEKFYDLRSTIGIDYQIIVTEPKLAKQLSEDRDYSRIIDILEHDKALPELKQYFEKTMNWRWKQLGMQDKNSYFYTDVTVNNVKFKKTPLGNRYNILSGEKEFIAFVNRYNKSRNVHKIAKDISVE